MTSSQIQDGGRPIVHYVGISQQKWYDEI